MTDFYCIGKTERILVQRAHLPRSKDDDEIFIHAARCFFDTFVGRLFDTCEISDGYETRTYVLARNGEIIRRDLGV